MAIDYALEMLLRGFLVFFRFVNLLLRNLFLFNTSWDSFFCFSFSFWIISAFSSWLVVLALLIEDLGDYHFLGETEIYSDSPASLDRVVILVGLALLGKALKPLRKFEIVQIAGLAQFIHLDEKSTSMWRLIFSLMKAACRILRFYWKSYSFLALKLTLFNGTDPGNMESNNWQKIFPAPRDSILVTLTYRVSLIHFKISPAPQKYAESIIPIAWSIDLNFQ